MPLRLLRLRFRSDAADVEKTVYLQGNIFVPITFRQVPEKGPFNDGDRISVFIRNHTSESIPLQYISVDAKLDVLQDVSVLEPGQETEAVFRVKTGVPPENVLLTVMPKAPVMELQQFGFAFQTGP
jgi:hypothetical protein